MIDKIIEDITLKIPKLNSDDIEIIKKCFDSFKEHNNGIISYLQRKSNFNPYTEQESLNIYLHNDDELIDFVDINELSNLHSIQNIFTKNISNLENIFKCKKLKSIWFSDEFIDAYEDLYDLKWLNNFPDLENCAIKINYSNLEYLKTEDLIINNLKYIMVSVIKDNTTHLYTIHKQHFNNSSLLKNYIDNNQ